MFTVAEAARLLRLDKKTLNNVLSISQVSTLYDHSGLIGPATLRILYARLRQES